jgi:hypothetical protein
MLDLTKITSGMHCIFCNTTMNMVGWKRYRTVKVNIWMFWEDFIPIMQKNVNRS